MRKNKLMSLALILVAIVACCFIGGTYAKYSSSVSKSSNISVAKWNFYKDNSTQKININLKENYDESTLLSTRNINGYEYKLIAPGTEGSFDIKLINTSEVGADFTLSIGEITNLPSNIKFYKDANYQNELIPGTSSITGSLKAGDSTGLDVKIYWKWPYETGTNNNGTYSGDELDNGINSDTNTILTVPITIKGVQAQPSVNPITTHIN